MRADVSEVQEEGKTRKDVTVWRTFRGNEWGNKGEVMAVRQGEDVLVGVAIVGGRMFYEQRSGCEFYFSSVTCSKLYEERGSY